MSHNQAKEETRTDAYLGRYLALFADATEPERIDGATWYPRFSDLIGRLGTQTGTDLETAAAVTAILSPMQSVENNLVASRMMLSGQFANVPALGKNVEKAISYIDGNRAALSGPKVTAFHRAIMGDLTAPVIDTHMISAVADLITTATVTPAQLRAMRKALTISADILSEPTATVQAIVWNVQRRLSGSPLTDWQYLETTAVHP